MTSVFNPILPRRFKQAPKYDPYEPAEYVSEVVPTEIYGLIAENKDAYLRIDAAIGCAHEASVEITQHPVEIGADISDFAIVQPRILKITGRISAVKPMKEGEQDDSLDVIGSSSQRVQRSWDALENAMRNRRLLEISTPLKLYENVLLQNLFTEQDAKTVRVLDFTATIQEIITVAVTETQLSVNEIAEGSARQQGSQTVNNGQVQPEEIEDAGILSSINSVG